MNEQLSLSCYSKSSILNDVNMSKNSHIKHSTMNPFYIFTIQINDSHIIQRSISSDTRPPAKPRRKRKSTAANNPNAPTNNNNPNNIPMNKDVSVNHCTISTPIKKRSPANTTYSQSAQVPMVPPMNSMPGVNTLIH